MAWQFDRPETGSGMVQAFRRMESAQHTMVFKLRGLDEQSLYTVTDIDTGKSRKINGRELMEKGLKIHVVRQSDSALITYKKQQ
ncbi:MAG: GH36 C-terminal domain-containing protein [Verrucomicrobia bacterium]|nr:GH36 C-terminal domain-containing protein [Verrucomicrobiota bacterium]